ncbi:MAG: hypothetical protein K0R54_1827 [Clostridiaceae bacterium]|jgi:hypothetical protein|nr:hypothetical protein [Clostridiaceae bacterium]
MPEILLSPQPPVEYDENDIIAMVTDGEQIYDALSDAISEIGLAKLTSMIIPIIAVDIENKTRLLGDIQTINTLYWTYSIVISLVKTALQKANLQDRINRLGPGDTLRVTTKYYEYQSASGNAWTRRCVIEFDVG